MTIEEPRSKVAFRCTRDNFSSCLASPDSEARAIVPKSPPLIRSRKIRRIRRKIFSSRFSFLCRVPACAKQNADFYRSGKSFFIGRKSRSPRRTRREISSRTDTYSAAEAVSEGAISFASVTQALMSREIYIGNRHYYISAKFRHAR